MVRFSPLMDKEVKAHLDELGEVVGDGSVDWVGSEDRSRSGRSAPDIPLVSWVSERCMRSVVLGLLGIYAEDSTGPVGKARLSSRLAYLSPAITIPFRASKVQSKKLRIARRI